MTDITAPNILSTCDRQTSASEVIKNGDELVVTGTIVETESVNQEDKSQKKYGLKCCKKNKKRNDKPYISWKDRISKVWKRFRSHTSKEVENVTSALDSMKVTNNPGESDDNHVKVEESYQEEDDSVEFEDEEEDSEEFEDEEEDSEEFEDEEEDSEEFEDEAEEEEEEEDVNSEGEPDEEVLAIVRSIEERWKVTKEECSDEEKDEFLKNVNASNVILRKMIGEQAEKDKRRENILESIARSELPSTSTNYEDMKYAECVKKAVGATPQEEPHIYAKYFPDQCSNRLIEFLIRGQRFVEPTEEQWKVLKADEDLKRSQMTPAELQQEREYYEMFEQVALEDEKKRHIAFLEEEDRMVREALLAREERKRQHRARRARDFGLEISEDEGVIETGQSVA